MGDAWRVVPLGDVCSIQARLVDPTLPDYRNMPHVGTERMESGTGRLLPLATATDWKGDGAVGRPAGYSLPA